MNITTKLWLCERIAIILHFIGFKPKCSSDIQGQTTRGYGKLSTHGYWQYQLPEQKK